MSHYCKMLFAKPCLFLLWGILTMTFAYAQSDDSVAHEVLPSICTAPQSHSNRLICQDEPLKTDYKQLQEKYRRALLSSNAAHKVLLFSQQQWEKFIQKCKYKACIARQIELRGEELNRFITLNQSLMQYFVRYHATQPSQPITWLQLQQLDKDQIKIEAIQFRHPHNSEASQYRYLRSYATVSSLDQIIDVESKCQYQIVRHSSYLVLKNQDARCQQFAGLYRLFD